MPLGQRLRLLRNQAGLSGAELARRVGVSPSLISRIERSNTTPSVGVLNRIAQTLGTPMAAIFDPEDDARIPANRPKRVWVVRKDERKILRLPKSHVSYELLTPDLARVIEFILVEHAAGELPPETPFVHEGEESTFVVKGQVYTMIDGEEIILEEGDCVTFDCSLPHYIVNRSKKNATLITAIVPPNF